MPGQARQVVGADFLAPAAIASVRPVWSRAANCRSRTTILPSLASRRLNGSMLEEPTVAHSPSMTATLAWRKLFLYSKTRMPSASRAL